MLSATIVLAACATERHSELDDLEPAPVGVIEAAASPAPPAVVGDRAITMNIVFPDAVFYHNGGRVIDVTRPPFNAKGDGVTDDTAALVKVMNVLRDDLVASRAGRGTKNYAVYLRNGTYVVSGTIMHDGANIGFAGLNIYGQDRAKTIIRLRDHSPGFEAGKQKPVLSWFEDWSSDKGSNIAWNNYLRNLTVDTGIGNPGAIGVAYIAANSGVIENLTVRSGDRQGYAGLLFPTWSVQGHFHDITVTGFDYGVRADPRAEANPVLEHVTVSNQRVAGVWVSQSGPSIRSLHSQNAVPAIVLGEASAQVVVVGSRLEGGAASAVAIDVRKPDSQHLFARGITTTGYGAAAAVGTARVPAGLITEYSSRPPVRLFPASPATSLSLPIENFPQVAWHANLADWAVVPDGASVAQIQAALDSGKPAILFAGTSYGRGMNPLHVPAIVKQIELLGTDLWKVFYLDAASTTPLWALNAGNHTEFVISAARTLVTQGGRVGFHVRVPAAKAFFSGDVIAYNGDDFCPAGTTIYGRSINDENRNAANFVVNGGTLWALGYKTEAAQASFLVKNHGTLEVLGGYRNRAATADIGQPQLYNIDSRVSLVGFCSMSRVYAEAIWEQRGTDLRKLKPAQLPRRLAYPEDFFIPMYSGY